MVDGSATTTRKTKHNINQNMESICNLHMHEHDLLSSAITRHISPKVSRTHDSTFCTAFAKDDISTQMVKVPRWHSEVSPWRSR